MQQPNSGQQSAATHHRQSSLAILGHGHFQDILQLCFPHLFVPAPQADDGQLVGRGAAHHVPCPQQEVPAPAPALAPAPAATVDQ